MTKEKIDPYKHKERWLKWKAETLRFGIKGISKANSDIILKYLSDMELGRNRGRGSPKGERKASRLNDLRGKMIFFAKKFKERFNVSDLTKVTEEQLFSLLKDMKDGVIEKDKGGKFKDIKTYARDFKAFWNWLIKSSGKEGKLIKSIVEDVDARPNQDSKFVFLRKQELDKLRASMKFEYVVLIDAILDFGIRPPTELNNLRVSDFSKEFEELHIRNDIVKRGSFGRTNKLTFSRKNIQRYVRLKKLEGDDCLFKIKSGTANKYIRRHVKRLFGTSMTKGGKPYHEISLYDFRHLAACYWGGILDKDRDIMIRMGWKQSNKIYYYSKFIKDEEGETDFNFDGSTSTEVDKKIEMFEKENKILKDKMELMQQQISIVTDFIISLKAKKNIADTKIQKLVDDHDKKLEQSIESYTD